MLLFDNMWHKSKYKLMEYLKNWITNIIKFNSMMKVKKLDVRANSYLQNF
jgi:hypothetical protein